MQMKQEDQYRIKELENRIANGELAAMFDYACLYQNQFPEYITPAIADKIVAYYTACMENGDLTAALNLGAMYYVGEHIKQDYQKAIALYEKATASETLETQVRAWCNLGYCYYYGRDIPVDNERAFNCYMRAALLRDANALYKIGDMYMEGRFVPQDESMAMAFYQQSWHEVNETLSPYPDICKRLGKCALYGIGMAQDSLLALDLLSRAEVATYAKIQAHDPFAPSLLPDIQQMLGEAKLKVEQELGLVGSSVSVKYK